MDDDDESVKLGFGTMPDVWVSAGTRDETTVNIARRRRPLRDGNVRPEQLHRRRRRYADGDGHPERRPRAHDHHPDRKDTTRAGPTSADYSGVPSSVTFNAGEMSKPFTFTRHPGHGG